MDEDKLFRIKPKEGCHLNVKRNDDGSRAGIQFDEENDLQGPIDLIEVDKAELIEERTVYVPVERSERSAKEIILEDAVAPALGALLFTGGVWAIHQATPYVKKAGSWMVSKGKTQLKRFARKMKKATSDKTDAVISTQENPGSTVILHTPEEVQQKYNEMIAAAVIIANDIRELSNTVVVSNGSDEAEKLELQKKLKTLSTSQIMDTIDFMLEENNRDMLDNATVVMFDAFRNRQFIINGELVPISEYIPCESVA